MARHATCVGEMSGWLVWRLMSQGRPYYCAVMAGESLPIASNRWVPSLALALRGVR
jgi:hypothetical protein